ncbi:MAG: hypothetical protein E6Q85_03180 [Thiothrix sp.]|nr:MAG: hypothetical protein E6Q85_03180 [Thiothrix sp.]
MKAIRIRPLKRLMLLVLATQLVVGCSSIQSNPVYQTWERQAYAAYHVSLPGPADGIVPNFFRTVAVPRMQVAPQRPVPQAYAIARNSSSQPLSASLVVPMQEQQYIADFYGL